MNFTENFTKILKKHTDLAEKMSAGVMGEEYIAIAKEYSDLEPIVDKINIYKNSLLQFESLQELLNKDENLESDLKEMAEQELHEISKSLPELLKSVKIALLPKDIADEKNAIIEVRAGTGGEEAALFAAELFEMYRRYAENRRWKFEILDIADTGIGGYKEASAIISGNNVFARLKFESGVHRVQRVPDTESNGRIHTSAATVAVLAEAEELDVTIEDKDLKIETYRASGAGGQHVNTTDSAVRILHIPTGIVVTEQGERSQHKNKAKALKILRAKVFELEREQKAKERSADRKQQVGSGDRSERIRTYNFPQGRVSDHRINLTLYKIHEMVYEGKLDEMIDALISSDEAEKLANSD
ncbi:MAG: peptide chain release factor 1 [Rickettsiaceae bacterium]|nr:peptide chain release factor 1 [Rickettsiaceae bacterium]